MRAYAEALSISGSMNPGICSGTDVAAAPETEEAVVSRFTEKMYRNARTVTTGWSPVNLTNPSATPGARFTSAPAGSAGGLAGAGIGLGDAVGVLAGWPVEIAPIAQGLWMRGASLTMLHQPTPRTDLVLWAEDTMTVIGMIEAKAVIVSEPFTRPSQCSRRRASRSSPSPSCWRRIRSIPSTSARTTWH